MQVPILGVPIVGNVKVWLKVAGYAQKLIEDPVSSECCLTAAGYTESDLLIFTDDEIHDAYITSADPYQHQIEQGANSGVKRLRTEILTDRTRIPEWE